jgi:hypothetical protein
VGDGRQRHGDTERGGVEEGTRDDHAIDEIVEGVADEKEWPSARVNVAVMLVAVPPHQQLLKDKEQDKSGEDCASDR